MTFLRNARAMALAASGAATLIAGVGTSGQARAWASADRFADKVLEAGGGGRFFTGSPVDPYTCRDCHSGGGEVPIQLVFPQTYSLGATYEVMVSWPTVDAHQVAAALEVVDVAGRPAGTLVVPEEGIPADAYCAADDPLDLFPAGVLKDGSINGTEEPGAVNSPVVARQIAIAEACEAHMLYAFWTAPATDMGPLHFVGGVVAGNSTGDETEYVDATGDAVTLIRRQVPLVEHTAIAPEIEFACAALPGRMVAGSAFGLSSVVATLVGLVWRRRRRH